MMSSIETIEYGKEIIEFELLQEKRKTLSIEVLPTTKIKVKAPENKSKQDIIKKIQKKAKWISKQKQYFVDNYKKPEEKKYINGECFLYLGKQYRLKLIPSNKNSIKLKQGYLLVEYSSKNPKKLINQWYKEKALLIYEQELEKCIQKFTAYKLQKPVLKIRKLLKRWGSYNKNSNTITINIDTIKAKKSCIDYVICHELCHCVYFSHNKYFYDLLEEKCKDWKKYKTHLEQLSL
ncbi:MAG: M48 family metallopeptidase [Candidatus Gastranaerophilaceae bacterium]